MPMRYKGKRLPEILTRGKYAYRRVGSFYSESEAEAYKDQTLHSLLVEADIPEQFGADVKYHVFRRIGAGG